MKKIIGIIIVVALGLIGFMVLRSEPQDTQEEVAEATSLITVVTVAELETGSAPIVAYGQVISSNSVAVVPETSGVVKQVFKKLGQTVRPGETILELQNSSEQQAVLQARSSLSSSQASLTRVNRGADDDQIAGAKSAVSAAESALDSTETSVLGSLDVLYSELDTLVTSDLSEFFNNPGSTFPSLKQDINSDAQETTLEEGLAAVNARFDQDRQYDDVNEALVVMRGNIDVFQDYTDQLINTFSGLTPTPSISQVTISRWSSDLVNTRNSLESKKVSVRGLESQFASAEQSVISAKETLDEVEDGADAEDISIAQSGVAGARAGLSSAQIQLAKTIIKAPTFGRISSIETRVGELVGPSAPVFVLASSDAKRIDVYLTEKEVARVQVGSDVIIDGTYNGTIARIAPAIDSQTGKVKVEIFADDIVTLTEGVGVGVSIASVTDTRGFSIPIEAVFVRGDQAYVYAVVDGKAVPTAIETDGLFGPQVVVTGGISGDTSIVSFARVVKDNQVITSMQDKKEEQATSTDSVTN